MRSPSDNARVSRRRTWPLQVASIATCLLAFNQAWAEGSQRKNALGAPRMRASAEAGGEPGAAIRPQIAVEKVLVSRTEQKTEVRVEGNGRLSFVTLRLSDPDRLVLDFSDARVRLQQKLIPGDLQPVRAVRVGQFKADVARVVIDLEGEVAYTIREDGNVVSVVFDSVPKAGAGAASQGEARLVNVAGSPVAQQSASDDKPRLSLPESLTQPVAARASPNAPQAGPSPPVLAEPHAGQAQTTQPATLDPVSEKPAANPRESAARSPEGILNAPLSESLAKPATVAATDEAAPPELPASASPGPRPDRTKATQPTAPALEAVDEGKDTPKSIWTPPDEDYVIGIEDVLAINVWKEPDVSRLVFVRPDGKISLPLIGELKANGLTPRLLQDAIVAKLRLFLYEPEVTVIVQEIRSQRFNIVGEVNRPGSYPLSKPMSVLDAIALAGGFRDFARVTQIYVLRLRPDGSRVPFPFNYKDAVKGLRLRDNLELETRDTIVVP